MEILDFQLSLSHGWALLCIRCWAAVCDEVHMPTRKRVGHKMTRYPSPILPYNSRHCQSPYRASTRAATASTCAVCGNVSTGCTASTSNPSATRKERSRANVAGLHET